MNDDDQLAHPLRLTPRGRLALTAADWILRRLSPNQADTEPAEQIDENSP